MTLRKLCGLKPNQWRTFTYEQSSIFKRVTEYTASSVKYSKSYSSSDSDVYSAPWFRVVLRFASPEKKEFCRTRLEILPRSPAWSETSGLKRLPLLKKSRVRAIFVLLPSSGTGAPTGRLGRRDSNCHMAGSKSAHLFVHRESKPPPAREIRTLQRVRRTQRLDIASCLTTVRWGTSTEVQRKQGPREAFALGRRPRRYRGTAINALVTLRFR
jgi:hypothetical protein